MPSQHHEQSAAASAPTTSSHHAASGPDPPGLAAPSSASTAGVAVRTGAGADAEPQACFVCMDAAADAVLIECGHGGLCGGALPSLASSCVLPPRQRFLSRILARHSAPHAPLPHLVRPPSEPITDQICFLSSDLHDAADPFSLAAEEMTE